MIEESGTATSKQRIDLYVVKESGTDTEEEDSPTGGEAGTTDTSKQRENL